MSNSLQGWESLNLAHLEEIYEQYQKDPSKVDPSWRAYFGDLGGEAVTLPPPSAEAEGMAACGDIRIYHLIHAYRTYGHLLAHVNPFSVDKKQLPRQLALENLGFKEGELDAVFPTSGLLDRPFAPLREIIEVLQEIYCGKIGIEYMGLDGPEMEQWLQREIEPTRFHISLNIDQKQMILQHLNKSELFESFLHTKYVGQKRFSLEGAETLIPILAAVIEKGSELGLDDFVLGMAHRGRLNVLSNILDKSYGDVFSEFEESYIPDSYEGSGDVKYHKGFSSELTTQQGHQIQVTLAPNPSHLEAVDPVVEGEVKAKQVQMGPKRVVPILIHGDAAIAGQGVIYETMQFCRLPGYETGGTIHIVINNQIGFTTLPKEGRSTYYCTDISRTFGAPVFHVNAEDPEACIYATLLAVELRQRFQRDVFIDLVCYRKYGHNEGDEPAFTQPMEYQQIRKKRPIREIYRDALIQQGVVEKYVAEQLEHEFKKALNEALQGSRLPKERKEVVEKPQMAPDLFQPVHTGVKKERIIEVAEKLCAIPDTFHIHRKLENLIKERLLMGKGEKSIDWGMGELLAYGTLLWEGHHVRLAGQDSCRGTFSHRHAVWVDQKDARHHFSLQHLHAEQGEFHAYNSSLSEYAALGFEVGYSIARPDALVIWEAQFGDFCNGAQVIIDQFISTSEQKWGRNLHLTLLLPHGYEGQGPEHSSARMERFLTLAGNDNMLIANPTNPAQLFHLLRRQILAPYRKPLIVFTPKGLLRHPRCVSDLQALTTGTFSEILDDPKAPEKPRKIFFCSGRIFYDLIAEREKRQVKDMAILRVEQLYPLHKEQLKQFVAKYSTAYQFFWVQEEPFNMGAWGFISPELQALLPEGKELTYIGRERSASSAAGSFALHKKEHAAILEKVFPSGEEHQFTTNPYQRA